MNSDTPIIFADGTEFYKQLAQEYTQHSKGLFILAPSASGKSYFIGRQGVKDWIDGDYLWPATLADLSSDEWNNDPENVAEVNRRSDVITYQAKKLGFWIIGSSSESLKPDAIVILPWEKQVQYIQNRENGTYDGGATTADIDAVKNHRAIIERWKQFDVPCFESIDDAVRFLVND